MHAVSRWILAALGLAVLGAGCSRHKEITSLQRKEAASLVSEAQFAVTLRDYARAEPLLAKAVALCPDTSDYFLSLGTVRRQMDNRAGAKQAYEQALDLCRDAYRRDGKNTQPLLQQIYVLALLGRMDDARDALAKAQKDHPDDATVRGIIESKQLDRLADDPGFKEKAL